MTRRPADMTNAELIRLTRRTAPLHPGPNDCAVTLRLDGSMDTPALRAQALVALRRVVRTLGLPLPSVTEHEDEGGREIVAAWINLPEDQRRLTVAVLPGVAKLLEDTGHGERETQGA